MKTTTLSPTTLDETMFDLLHQLSDNKSQQPWKRSKYHDDAISLLTRRKLIDKGAHGYHKVITDKGLLFFKSDLPYDEWLDSRSKPAVHIGHNIQASKIEKSNLSAHFETRNNESTKTNIVTWIMSHIWQVAVGLLVAYIAYLKGWS